MTWNPPLTIKQMRSFAKKVLGHNINVYYYSGNDERLLNFQAHIGPDKDIFSGGEFVFAIYIHKEGVCSLSKNYIKSIILHELGHIVLFQDHYRSSKNKNARYTFKNRVSNSKREYETQIWAINMAHKLKMFNIEKSLKRIILKDWTVSKRANNYYYLASKIAVKNGIK